MGPAAAPIIPPAVKKAMESPGRRLVPTAHHTRCGRVQGSAAEATEPQDDQEQADTVGHPGQAEGERRQGESQPGDASHPGAFGECPQEGLGERGTHGQVG